MAKKEKEELMVKEEKENNLTNKENEVSEKKEKEEAKSFSPILASVIIALIGVIFLFIPEDINSIIGYITGGAFILVGLITIIRYIKQIVKPSILTLLSGILYAAMGIIVVIKPLIIMQLATIIFGIYLIVNGVLKMYNGYLTRNSESNKWKVLLISGTIIVIFGVILIINPFSSLVITKITGACLLVVAIFDIINNILNKEK